MLTHAAHARTAVLSDVFRPFVKPVKRARALAAGTKLIGRGQNA